MSNSEVHEKIVFVDGNLQDGKVTIKRGIVSHTDNHYIYFIPEGSKESIRIGHNFVVKVVPIGGGDE